MNRRGDLSIVDNEEKKIYKFPFYRFPRYQIHELADQYPIMSEEERNELEHSLLTAGQARDFSFSKCFRPDS